ncbi:DNA mismatch repair protein MutS [Persicobacter sp. CCB-QB2]|uniref:DNA mismatch repair protein MutS n=1 Tax=Persicobacter sp. CCB-QB2 TaxID=1561025 RepID=UPI0006A9444B|nr:DNA mismatch repair protein MutS [Persicobacter sp. CCB-QB2]
MAKGSKETPLMKQYNAIKTQYPGALLLFRVGDFYETFGQDAVTAAKVLDIVLTKRANGSASHVELAGFPHHALDAYLPRLVRAGHRVAICDQLEDPKSVKGIVKRGVTELVTPGLSFNDQVLDQKVNNYLAAVYFGKTQHGVSFLDLSTGEFSVAMGDLSYIENLIQSFRPSEILYSRNQKEAYTASFRDQYNTFSLEEWIFSAEYGYDKLKNHFRTDSLKGFGIEGFAEGIIAAGAVLFYLEDTEHKEVAHITSISRIEEDRYVWLDKFTIRNLELLYPQQEGGVPLIQVLDHTLTPMGGRLLKKWMVLPLKDLKTIRERHACVEAFTQEEELQELLQEQLRHIYDLERLISKVAAGRINPREMVQLKKALMALGPIRQALLDSPYAELQALAERIHPCQVLFERIATILKEDPPMLIHQGNLINDGINAELDELRQIAFSGKDYLESIKEREKERTGIPSLKISYNKVFGYYLEVSKAHQDKVPEEWIRKQTLVNAERYITQELKVYEEKILGAEEKLQVIEQALFRDLVAFATDFIGQVQQNALAVASIDCLSSFAQAALEHDYTKPQMSEDLQLDIKAGRHPVIEKQLPAGEPYIPNDIYLDDADQQIIIITGPNMAGKSALLRQTALIVLMAQMGSFVPAEAAQIGWIDKVFTRVGASDNLSKGESTFMVEMTETASIMNNLSERSLILMDEIGRGTSTYDGVSIAWSIVEYLHNHQKCKAKTLFATHYHELNQLSEDFKGIKNYNVSVKEMDGKVIFLRKLRAGGSEHSFGIHVAQLAGMPKPIVSRANEVLAHLEESRTKEKTKERIEAMPKNNFQMNLFDAVDPKLAEVERMIRKMDVNTLTPIEALMKLNELKSKLEPN